MCYNLTPKNMVVVPNIPPVFPSFPIFWWPPGLAGSCSHGTYRAMAGHFRAFPSGKTWQKKDWENRNTMEYYGKKNKTHIIYSSSFKNPSKSDVFVGRP